MTTAKIEIPLHDGSLMQVSKTDSGAIYLELLSPMTLRDGHGMAVKGSRLLSPEDTYALRALLSETE